MIVAVIGRVSLTVIYLFPDKLEKKLGRINPETLSAVMKGKIKLNPAEKKEFDEFMKGVQRMFASKQYSVVML